MKFVWRIFSGHTTVQMFEEAHKMLVEEKAQPSQLKCRTVFMSTHNVTNWGQNHYEEKCKRSATRVAFQSIDFEPDRWSFLGPVDEEK